MLNDDLRISFKTFSRDFRILKKCERSILMTDDFESLKKSADLSGSDCDISSSKFEGCDVPAFEDHCWRYSC